MKRIFVLAMVLTLVFSMMSAASAVTPQTASGLIGEGDDFVRVTVELAGGWSAQFYPAAFYLYDKAFDENTTEFAAYGTIMSAEDYASLLEEYADEPDAFVDMGSYVTHKTASGQNGFYAPVSDDKYILLNVDEAFNPEVVWSRISYALESYAAKETPQVISAVINSTDDKPVRVTVNVVDGVSVEYYPRGFRMFSDGAEIASGAVMTAENFADIQESYETPDEGNASTLEEKDGYYLLTHSDKELSVGCYAPINDELFGMLNVDPAYDTDYIWSLVAFAVEVEE